MSERKRDIVKYTVECILDGVLKYPSVQHRYNLKNISEEDRDKIRDILDDNNIKSYMTDDYIHVKLTSPLH